MSYWLLLSAWAGGWFTHCHSYHKQLKKKGWLALEETSERTYKEGNRGGEKSKIEMVINWDCLVSKSINSDTEALGNVRNPAPAFHSICKFGSS